MPDFTFELIPDQKQISRAMESLREIPHAHNRAMSGAINRTLTSGRTMIKREIMGELNVSQKATLRVIKIRRASPSKPGGSITVSREPIKLGEFHPKKTKEGVQVQVRKSKGAEVIKHAFIATMPSGHTGVFKRFPDAKAKKVMTAKGPRWHGLRIKELYGPTVVGVLAGKPGLAKKIQTDIEADFGKNLNSQVSRLLAETKKAG
jgi:hypothetical protein